MTAVIMPPDERAFREHLAGGAFRLGEAKRQWSCESIAWPHVIMAISAAPRPGSPDRYHLCFDLSGYPSLAPTAAPWDPSTQAPLAHAKWPTGSRRFTQVFRKEWHNGSCLYAPCDRRSMEGHPDWPGSYPSQIWRPTSDITYYLRIVHELLTSVAYTGVTP